MNNMRNGLDGGRDDPRQRSGTRGEPPLILESYFSASLRTACPDGDRQSFDQHGIATEGKQSVNKGACSNIKKSAGRLLGRTLLAMTGTLIVEH